MLSLTHTLISLPFAFYFESPPAIFVGAFIFHLLADTLLHWNLYPEVFKRWFYPLAAVDVISGILVAWYLTGNAFFTLPILLAIFAGNLPDIMQGLWDLAGASIQKHLSFAKPFFVFHDNLQLETKDPVRGLIWQVVLLIGAFVLIVRFI